MILGGSTCCFEEIDDAVAALQRERGDDRPVVFAWQLGEVPIGSIVYNFDLVGEHFGFVEMRNAAQRASEIWDFSSSTTRLWRAVGIEAKYVPLGYHPSMTRFERVESTIDVVFCGSINERRAEVLRRLRKEGLSVFKAPADRIKRDDLLAKCRCSINMLYYPNGPYPALRAAHLHANDVPFVGERAPECEWDPVYEAFVDYDEIVDAVLDVIESGHGGAQGLFKARPMVLP